MRYSNIEIGTPGIKRALNRYSTPSSIAEFVWNGFDAGADTVNVEFEADAFEGIQRLSVVDNGSGIPRSLLDGKFKPFLHSNKVINPDETHYGPSAKHGKNGIGRLTFFKFAGRAVWDTTYQISPGQYRRYEIEVDAQTLNSFSSRDERQVNGTTGTTVTFTKTLGLSIYQFNEVIDFLIKEFAWYLELQSPSPKSIKFNGRSLDYSKFVGERDQFTLTVNGHDFDVKYIRWQDRLNSEYSRYYFVGSDGRERAKKHTTFNNKGDDFYHSVYVQSGYFDSVQEPVILRDSDGGQDEQPTLFSITIEREETFKDLVRQLSEYLKRKRSPFLRKRAVKYVEELEAEDVFPKFGYNVWDQHRKRELSEVVREVYEADPRIFSGLNVQQKQTLLQLFSLVMDSSERDNLLNVLTQVVNLDTKERDELAKILQSTQLSNVITTIKMIEDRYTAVSELRKMVLDHTFGANERDHLQTHIERHYWLFGEQYHLVTAAEPNFEQALRRYLYILKGEDLPRKIDHPSKEREMDIFIVRWLKQTNRINNVVVELKHPNVMLGKKEYDQVKEYMDVILNQDDFNAKNMDWQFFLVGNKYNDYIEGELESAKAHGEEHLVFKRKNYKIYALTWSDVFGSFELRHQFLLDKLKIERAKLATKEASADDIIAQGHKNTAMVSNVSAPVVPID